MILVLCVQLTFQIVCLICFLSTHEIKAFDLAVNCRVDSLLFPLLFFFLCSGCHARSATDFSSGSDVGFFFAIYYLLVP